MSVAEDLVAAFEPWLTPDLETYLTAIGGMFSEVELYAIDEENDELGWAILLDPDRAPVAALPYLAQYVGERLPVGLDEAGMREWIKDAPNQRRGTVESIVRVAQRYLTGQRTVAISERSGGGANPEDYLIVQTYTSETPYPAVTFADLRRDAVPADIVLTHNVMEGQAWQQVKDDNPTWQDVKNDFATWEDLRVQMPGFTVWTRPRLP
jgi:hypothetical protein